MKTTNENILIELNKAVKALHFYPKGHPNLDGAIERFYTILTESLATKENIVWSVDKRGFYEKNQPIAQTKSWVANLAKEFFIRRIKKITFSGEITMGGLKTFLSIFKEKPENLLRRGGIGKQLAEEGAAGITLEDVIYEDFNKLTEEIMDKDGTEEETVEVKGEEEEKRAEEEKEFKEGQEEPEMKIETPSDIASQEAETGEQMDVIQTESLDIILQNLDKLEETKKSLYELLKELEQEKDTKNYLKLVDEIREKIDESQDEKEWDDIFSTLEIFLFHSTSEGNKSKDIEAIAHNNLKELLTNDTIIYLLNRLCRRKEEKRHAIQQMLLNTGESGVNLLLNALPDTKEANARRHLYNTLLLFGEAVRDEAEKRIDDERWFIVRQMVALLGKIGNPQSILALKKALIHPEPRVRKEVIKSLARIPCKESLAILLRTLKVSDKSFVLSAIISLGVLKEQAAIEPLGGIALHRDTFSENINMRKEAVKALGLIGDEKAIPILTELLSRKVWFGKKGNEEIRALAVISLGKIGGETAYKTIEDTAKTTRGIVLHACERSLKEIK